MLDKLIYTIKNTSPNIRKIIANMSWMIAGRFLRIVVGLVVVAWMARYLGAAQFGTLNYAMALVAIFSNIAELGLSNFVVRDSVHELEARSEILGTAFFLRLIGGITSFFLVFPVVFSLRPDDLTSRTIVTIVSGSLLFQNFSVIEFWFCSQVQAKYTVLASNLAFIIMSVIRISEIRHKSFITGKFDI